MGMNKQIVLYSHEGLLLNNKKEQTINICSNMVESQTCEANEVIYT